MVVIDFGNMYVIVVVAARMVRYDDIVGINLVIRIGKLFVVKMYFDMCL